MSAHSDLAKKDVTMKLEDLHHFDVGGSTDEGDADVSLTCLRCTNSVDWIPISTNENGRSTTLADLIGFAQQHLDKAHGGGS